MQYVIGFVLIVGAALLYLWLCGLLVTYVITPLALVCVAAGAVAGLVTVVVAVLRVLWVGRPGVKVLRPIDVVAGQLPGKAADVHAKRDLAWPQYFAMQALLDAKAVVRLLTTAVRLVWAAPARSVRAMDFRIPLIGWPLLVLPVAAAAGYTAGVLVAGAAVLVLGGVVALAAWTVGLLLVGVLRGFDRTWQVAFRAGGTCPKCYHTSRRPAYRCPGVHSAPDLAAGRGLHRDVRPGRLGVLWRRCGCGRLLPTTVLRAAISLQATCPLCGTELPKGAAVYTDVRIPVFGAPSAGKTHLIMATLVTLLRASDPPQRELAVADDYSQQVVDGYTHVFDSDGSAPKTDASAQPVAVTVRVRNGRRRAMVHVFDAAGEALADRAQNERFAYLDRARTLAFVLDPFSIPDLRDRYATTRGDVFERANAAKDDPENSYLATVSRLRDYGVDTNRQKLAFVLSKQDLLGQLLGADAPGEDQSSLRRFLLDRQLDNLVTLAERDFGAVRYFIVSTRHSRAETVTEPFRWLLTGEHVKLPAA